MLNQRNNWAPYGKMLCFGHNLSSIQNLWHHLSARDTSAGWGKSVGVIEQAAFVASGAPGRAAHELRREVYVVLGVPIDVDNMTTIRNRIEAAVFSRTPFLISTVNINFLITSQTNAKFKKSLLRSDLCTADGVPVIWIARLLGIPVRKISGSDLFDELKLARTNSPRLKVFFFGGTEGTASAASEKLNASKNNLTCVGSYYPGFGSVADMSTAQTITTINSSNADFLVAALGANKGQTWLLHNHDRLKLPVRAHLGTTINIQAGAIKRAPKWMQKVGLEWVWRVKEEPHLWTRYAHDGFVLLGLFFNRALPLAALTWWHRRRQADNLLNARIEQDENPKAVALKLNGPFIAENIGAFLPYFERAATSGKDVVINFTGTHLIDARFLGLLLMLDQHLGKKSRRLKFTGITPRIGRILRLNGFAHLT